MSPQVLADEDRGGRIGPGARRAGALASPRGAVWADDTTAQPAGSTLALALLLWE